MAKSALLRRRGVRRTDGGRTTLLIGLVGLLVVAALMLGILLGTHLASPSADVTGGIGSLRGGKAVAGVHELMEAKSLDEMKEIVRRHNEDQSRKHLNDDETAGEIDSGHINAGEDDDKVRKGGETADEGDMSPSKKPHGGPAKPYPYSLDPVPSSIDFTSWTPLGGKRFEEYISGDSPWLVTDETRRKSDEQARSRREHVRNAMKFAWDGYVKYAFGADELLPQTKKGNSAWGGTGTTLVDSLDTLWLMGLKDEFWQARDWVRDHLSYDVSSTVSVFETTIRSLGGLLSAYDWSQDKAFLEKAKDLGDRLFRAFGPNSDIPMGQVNLKSGHTNNLSWAGGNVIIAEAGTLQIEFRYLAKMTGKHEFATKTEKVYDVFNKISRENGLFPYFLRNSANPPTFANEKLTFGAMADSLYEYMLKIWIQGGRQEPLYRSMYDKAIQGMHDELLQKSTPSGLTYIADKNYGKMDHKMDHLVCFMGGLLALGAYTDPLGLESERAQRDLKTAKALTYTCYQMYARMNTGISAEFIQFYDGKDFEIGRGAPHYLLRPEAFESFFILSYLTGDPVYREWSWECFLAIERYCKTAIAFGQLKDVSRTEQQPQNKMESFFLAETLKYLFLAQDPDTEVDILHKHVFNTEAHPVRIFPVIDESTT